MSSARFMFALAGCRIDDFEACFSCLLSVLGCLSSECKCFLILSQRTIN